MTALLAFTALSLASPTPPTLAELVTSQDGKVKLHLPAGWMVGDSSRKDYASKIKNLPPDVKMAIQHASGGQKGVSLSVFDIDPKRVNKAMGEFFNVVVIQTGEPTLEQLQQAIDNGSIPLDKMLPWEKKPSTTPLMLSGHSAMIIQGHVKDLPRPGNQKISFDAVSLTVFRNPNGYIITFGTFSGKGASRVGFVKRIATDILASTPP